MSNRLTTAPTFSGISNKYENNGIIIPNDCVGTHEGNFLFVSEIKPLFQGYADGMKNMEIFLKGEFNYVCPNADISTFLYDPFTGRKIDWDNIRKAILGH